jgi:uncharacterized protein YbaP (TraB family)
MKKLLLATLFAFGSTSVFAQEWITYDACDVTGAASYSPAIPKAIMREAALVENGVGRLWRITSSSGSVSHLWGTMHSSHPELLRLPAELRAVLQTAKVVANERMKIATSRAELDRWGDKSWMGGRPPSVNDDRMDPRIKEWVTARFQSLGVSPARMNAFSYAGLAGVILSSPCNDFTKPALPIMDQLITAIAVSYGARPTALESPRAAWDKMAGAAGEELSIALLHRYGALYNPELADEDPRGWAALYLQGRVAELVASERHYLIDFFGAEKADHYLKIGRGYLVDERNLTFLDSALPLLDAGQAVLAVGAGHLSGPKGLVTMFRNAGFSVERIRTEGEGE